MIQHARGRVYLLETVSAAPGEEVVVAGDPVACRSWFVRVTLSPPPGPPLYLAGRSQAGWDGRKRGSKDRRERLEC